MSEIGWVAARPPLRVRDLPAGWEWWDEAITPWDWWSMPGPPTPPNRDPSLPALWWRWCRREEVWQAALAVDSMWSVVRAEGGTRRRLIASWDGATLGLLGDWAQTLGLPRPAAVSVAGALDLLPVEWREVATRSTAPAPDGDYLLKIESDLVPASRHYDYRHGGGRVWVRWRGVDPYGAAASTGRTGPPGRWPARRFPRAGSRR